MRPRVLHFVMFDCMVHFSQLWITLQLLHSSQRWTAGRIPPALGRPFNLPLGSHDHSTSKYRCRESPESASFPGLILRSGNEATLEDII